MYVGKHLILRYVSYCYCRCYNHSKLTKLLCDSVKVTQIYNAHYEQNDCWHTEEATLCKQPLNWMGAHMTNA